MFRQARERCRGLGRVLCVRAAAAPLPSRAAGPRALPARPLPRRAVRRTPPGGATRPRLPSADHFGRLLLGTARGLPRLRRRGRPACPRARRRPPATSPSAADDPPSARPLPRSRPRAVRSRDPAPLPSRAAGPRALPRAADFLRGELCVELRLAARRRLGRRLPITGRLLLGSLEGRSAAAAPRASSAASAAAGFRQPRLRLPPMFRQARDRRRNIDGVLCVRAVQHRFHLAQLLLALAAATSAASCASNSTWRRDAASAAVCRSLAACCSAPSRAAAAGRGHPATTKRERERERESVCARARHPRQPASPSAADNPPGARPPPQSRRRAVAQPARAQPQTRLVRGRSPVSSLARELRPGSPLPPRRVVEGGQTIGAGLLLHAHKRGGVSQFCSPLAWWRRQPASIETLAVAWYSTSWARAWLHLGCVPVRRRPEASLRPTRRSAESSCTVAASDW